MRQIFASGVYPAPVDPTAVEQEWREKGFSFDIFRDPPGQEWNDFVHSTDEYVVVAKGSITISVGVETAECEAGDLVWIPRETAHSLKTTSADGSVWMYGYGQND